MLFTLGVLLAGCGTAPGVFRIEMPVERPAAPPVEPSAPVEPAATTAMDGPGDSSALIAQTEPASDPAVSGADADSMVAQAGADAAIVAETGADAASMLAQAGPPPAQPGPGDEGEFEPYDPWERFNEAMFDLNLKLDRYVLRPAARVYRKIMPEPFQLLISNAFDNISWPPRFINSLLQGKFGGAGREFVRFLINSTAGVGGIFDPAKDYWGIRPSKEDFGQTLGVWGAGPGPYLVLPLFGPTTVRDGVGRGVDTFLDPLSYFLPFLWDRAGMKAGDILNERALNYELFEGVQETTLDLYSSVRHFYLRRRELMIKE